MYKNHSNENLQKVSFKNHDLANAAFVNSDLRGTDFSGANLTGATLTSANMAGANLSGADLTGVIIMDKNWLDMLDDWGVIGAKEIQSSYKMIDESFNGEVKFHLERIKN